ncbi:MAG: DEAD/DEAH box helicase [Fibrobacterota bacterium]|nr:DEAD/DEAH box helicase [Fibrobacterota bacterium]QQS07496.1 MAG: DEAD/DEAH box helicase [Fibrobacterota bacterium]
MRPLYLASGWPDAFSGVLVLRWRDSEGCDGCEARPQDLVVRFPWFRDFQAFPLPLADLFHYLCPSFSQIRRVTALEFPAAENVWQNRLTRTILDAFATSLGQFSSILRTRGKEFVGLIGEIQWSDSPQGWTARVEGAEAFQLWAGPTGETSCNCTSARSNGDCRHQVAFLMRMGQESPSAESVAVDAEDVSARRYVPERNTQLEAWIATAAKRLGPVARDRDASNEVVFQLCLNSQKLSWDLVPTVRRFSKAFPHGKIEDRDLRNNGGYKQQGVVPSYASPADEEIIQLARSLDAPNLPGRKGSWQHALLLAYRLKKLLGPAAEPLRIDDHLWRLRIHLRQRGDEVSPERELQSLDAPERILSLPSDAAVIGGDRDFLVLVGATLHLVDPRVERELLLVPVGNAFARSVAPLRADLRTLSDAGVAVDLDLLPEAPKGVPEPGLTVELHGEDTLAIEMTPWYEQVGIVAADCASVVAYTGHDGRIGEMARDAQGEAALRDRLQRLLEQHGVDFEKVDSRFLVAEPKSLRAVALQALPAMSTGGWRIVSSLSMDRWKRRTGQVHVRVQPSGQDWFELGGTVDFEGLEVPLSTLVGTTGTVLLPDGSTGVLPDQLVKQLRWISALGDKTDDGIRLQNVHASLADELLGIAGVATTGAIDWTGILESINAVDAFDAPTSLKATLRHYQLDGARWLDQLRRRGTGGILADDMGLGKTVQVIAHLCRMFELDPHCGPALVVAPASVAGNWVDELKKFAPHLPSRLLHGAQRDLVRDADSDGPVVYVTTFGILPREMDWAKERKFSVVVLDESQAIRNPETVLHRTVKTLDAHQKICLTGTPIENSLSDLWAQFNFLNPGLLGTREAFLQQFEPSQGDAPDFSRLRRLTAPFWLRRTKEDVARDLPKRQDVDLMVDLDPKQAALYRRQLLDYQKNLLPDLRENGMGEGNHFQVLTALLRLRQIACAPELASHKGPSTKIDSLVEMLHELLSENHRALVFSSFTSLLDLVGKRLSREGIDFLRFDGSTPAAERTRKIKRFQEAKDENVFLISLKSGGAGVNLTSADTVFLLDPWWNPAAESQAAARSHRIGQERPVTVYRMIARGTIEERVLALARSKAELARDLFDAGESGGAMLTPDLIAELLEPSDAPDDEMEDIEEE